MAGKTRERHIASSDLDIFGDVPDDGVDNDSTLDIFGASETEAGNEEVPETTEAPADTTEEVETTETPVIETKETPEETPEQVEVELPETVEETDIDIDKLFDTMEEEIKKEGNDEMIQLVDDLRSASADKDTELMEVRKQNEILRDKLLNRAGEDAELWIYKPMIDNLEKNRPLKFLATYFSTDMNEKNKDRVVGILADFIQDLTGQDVSDMIQKNQTDKIAAISGGSSAVPIKEAPKEDKPKSFQESITDMF